LLIACVLLFYIRLIISLFAFIRRKVSWFEGITVGTLYGIMLAGFTVWGKEVSPTKDSWDIAGFLLFCFGSYINSLSDYQRHIWKKRPENSGRLYTEGLFRYSMHINYFGDSVMLVGFAIVTQNPLSFIPVLLIILNLLFLQIPRLDDHLKNKYGAEFLEYEIKTRKFIPFIY
jgi:steroid 5-alpha reductase family enzyme